MEKLKKYTELIDKLILYSLCALIIGLPFSNSIIEIAASIAIGLWFFKKAFILHSFKIEKTPLNTPISVYFIFVVLSMISSKFFMTSLTGFGFKAMEHFLLFVVIIDTVKTKTDFEKLIAAILFSCALIGIDGLWQLATGYDFIRGYPLWSSGRITASFKFPNGFGAWLVTVIPVCISLAIFNVKEKAWKISGISLSLLLLSCLILNITMGALIAIIPAFIFLGYKKGSTAKKVLLVLLLIAIFAVVTITIFGDTKFTSYYIFKGHSAFHRVELVKLCWRMFIDHPFLGHGINTFMSIFENYSSTFMPGGISYAHNCYLQMAVETGIFGLMAFLWMIGVLFVSSSKDINRRKKGFIRTTQIGLLAGLLGYLAHSMVETNLYALQLAILFYYFLGLAVSIQKLEKP